MWIFSNKYGSPRTLDGGGSPDLEGSYRLVKTIEPFGVYELRFEIDAKFMNNIK